MRSVPTEELVKHFKTSLDQGLRKAQLYVDILPRLEFRALRYSVVRKLAKLGAEFYVLDSPERFYFPVATRYLRFLPDLKRVATPSLFRANNSLFFSTNLRYHGHLYVYAGELDERPYSTPFDLSAPSEFTAETDDKEIREWFRNTARYFGRHKRILQDYGPEPPPLPSHRTILFTSRYGRGDDSIEFWNSRYFSPYLWCRLILTEDDIRLKRRREQEELERHLQREKSIADAIRSIEARGTPIFSEEGDSADKSFCVYKVQAEDLAPILEPEALEKIRGVAENLYLVITYYIYFLGYMNVRWPSLSLPYQILKACRMLEHERITARIYELGIKNGGGLPRLLIVVKEGDLERRNYYVGFTPRRDIDFKAPSRIIRTGSRIILLPS